MCLLAGIGGALAVGCHSNNNQLSGYGVGWVTVANGTGPYANGNQFLSYVVNLDAVVLNDSVGNQYTAIATVEPVDLVKLSNIAELWGSATIPADTYVSATITLDYTSAAVWLLINGVPTQATVAFPNGVTPTTVAITVLFDPNDPLVVTDSYATSNAQRLALDFDLAASNLITSTTSGTTTVTTVTASPYVRFANVASDTRNIRIRGPLVNSNLSVGTYSIYERPFYDEVNSIGTLSIFNNDATIYTINGTTYVGAPGLEQLSETSTGVTTTMAYTRFEVTPSTNNSQGQPSGTAGIFNSLYVVAGGSLETFYTENITGEVAARVGNTLTLKNATLAGATVSLPEGYFEYVPPAPTVLAQVLVGPSTIVTAEGNSSLTNLDYNSIAVGQKISAIGTYTSPSSTNIVINAVSPTTGSTAGQVRLLPTQLFGTLNGATAGALTLDLTTIDDLPVDLFDFTGNGATTPIATAFNVSTPGQNFSSTPTGTPLWIDGAATAFGTAPPDFTAYYNLQNAPTPSQVVSPVNLEADVPASLQVLWSGTATAPGTTTPFTQLTAQGIQINSSIATSAFIQVGPERIPLSSLTTALTVVPNNVANCVVVTNLPAGQGQQPCRPLYSYGPVTIPATTTTSAYNEILENNSFATFATNLNAQISATTPVIQFAANGYYNSSTQTFTATNIDVVLVLPTT
jgi:hypothetical protein